MSMELSQSSHTRQVTVILIALLAVGGVAVAPGVVVAQDDQDDQPPLPAAYYGDITVDGEPGDNVEITAEINGEERGSIVAEDGSYGGSGTLDEKLVVNGEDGEQGATVEFFVDGEPVETDSGPISYEPGVNQQVNITVESDGTATATVGANGQATLEFDADESQGVTRATLDGLPQGVEVVISTSSGPTGDAEARGTGAVYLDISPDTSVSSSVDISVEVQQSTLDSFNDPSLYRYDGSSWNELETSVSGNTITATSPNGLSPFAIDEATGDDDTDTGTEDDDDDTSASGGGGGGGGGSLIAEFLATNLDSSTTEVTQGDAITVSAELESDGIVQDTQDVDLRIGGETIATQSVELSSGATTTVEFTDVTVDVDPGEYEYGIYTDDDSVTGTITVVADETADEEAADEEADEEAADEAADEEAAADEPADDTTEDGIPGFGPVVALIALVAAALLATRRRDT